MTWREARGDGKRFFRCAASAQAVGGAKLRTMDEDLTSYRNLFPITRESHYLNHAAVSPTSTRVRDTAQDWLSDLVHHGMANIVDWIRRERETRASAARILGACVDEIAFIRSTSHGLSTFAEGIDWKPGDEVAVCTALEFPANVYPWMHLESRGVVVRPIDETEGGVVAEAVAKALGPRTRVVSVSSVEFATGVATDLEAIGALCRERGVLLCVDGIQSVGAFPIDVKRAHIDFLAADSHKWQLGLPGIGIAYVRRELAPSLRPPVVGWKSVKNPLDFDHLHFELREDAARLEEGTQSFATILGMGAALALLEEVGVARIASHIQSWLDEAASELAARGLDPGPLPSMRKGILTFRPPFGSADDFVQRAAKAGVVLSARRARVRVSPHFYNGEPELAALLNLVRGG
jgi:selenocysteine lyase/cysteine desulfurase